MRWGWQLVPHCFFAFCPVHAGMGSSRGPPPSQPSITLNGIKHVGETKERMSAPTRSGCTLQLAGPAEQFSNWTGPTETTLSPDHCVHVRPRWDRVVMRVAFYTAPGTVGICLQEIQSDKR